MMTRQELMLPALSVALQHPAVSSDPKNICTLLQVCKSWRAAVQQSSAGSTEVSIQFHYTAAHLRRLAGFASWLPKHCGLVKVIKWEDDDRRGPAHEHEADIRAGAVSLIEFALQLAAGPPHAPAVDRQRSAPLRLCSYSSGGIVSPMIIKSLPAATLTDLSLSLSPNNSKCLAVISRLTGLKQLKLDITCNSLDGFCLHIPDLVALQQLENLSISGLASNSNTQQLPAQLKQLSLGYAGRQGQSVLQLAHLQQLQQLDVQVGDIAAGCVLPPQLHKLSVLFLCGTQQSAVALLGISQLRHLSVLKLAWSNDSAEQLLQLAGLPQLQELSLAYMSQKELTRNGVSAAWRNIKQLQDLRVDIGIVRAQDGRQLFQDIGCTTQLTSLVACMEVGGADPDSDDEDDELSYNAVCEHLKGLTNLQELHLYLEPQDWFRLSDTLHLTVLKGLRDLSFHYQAPAVDDAVIACLAMELTNLERLYFGDEVIDDRVSEWGVGALPNVGKLTKLQSLTYGRLLSQDARWGLSFLTGLTQLTELCGFQAAGTEALADFWSIVRCPSRSVG